MMFHNISLRVGLIVLVVCCVPVPNASAQQHPISARVRLQDTSPPSAELLEAQATTFVRRPTVPEPRFSPYGNEPQTIDLILECVDFIGQSVPDCDITLEWFAEPSSGGHVHNNSRPPGRFMVLPLGPEGGTVGPGPSGILVDNTGVSGRRTARYTTPHASGVTKIRLTGMVDGQPVIPTEASIGVRIDGLQLASGAGLEVNTASNMHDNNNGFATPFVTAKLQELAALFAAELAKVGVPADQVPRIRLTAISLPQGELFDIPDGGVFNEWGIPHKGHRFGTNIDVGMRTLTDPHKKALAKALGKMNKPRFEAPVPNESPRAASANHWHLCLPCP